MERGGTVTYNKTSRGIPGGPTFGSLLCMLFKVCNVQNGVLDMDYFEEATA